MQIQRILQLKHVCRVDSMKNTNTISKISINILHNIGDIFIKYLTFYNQVFSLKMIYVTISIKLTTFLVSLILFHFQCTQLIIHLKGRKLCNKTKSMNEHSITTIIS